MSRPTSLHLGNTLYWVLRTYDTSYAPVDADSTPTVAVRKNGSSVGDSVTVTKRSATTGIYDCSYNPAGEVVGDQFTIEETATISSVTYTQSWEFRVTSQVADSVTGAVGSVTGNVGGNVVGSVASVSGTVNANVTQFGGTNGTFSAGRPEVNTTHWAGTAVGSANVRANVTQFGGSNGTFTGGRPEVNATHWAGTAVASATVNANMTQISGDSVAADNLESACDGTGFNVGNGLIVAASVTAGVTVATNGISNASIADNAISNGKIAGATFTSGKFQSNYWDEVQARGLAALVGIHLDHLLAVDYDPASKPGVDTALLNELVRSDAGVSQFTANALELAPGGGGSSVTVTPLSSSVNQRVNGTTVEMFVGETCDVGPLAITDATGAAVDLSGKTLQVAIEGVGVDVAVVASGDITVSGASNNQITFSAPAAATTKGTNARTWSLRDTADGNRVLARGNWKLLEAAKADA